MDAIETWHSKSKDKAVIDYGFHLMIGDLNEQRLKNYQKHWIKAELVQSKFLAYAKNSKHQIAHYSRHLKLEKS